ncbi:MAG: hypothetical protein KME54_05595 [Tolypothrix brevis GSE-NOS-MK-07-07A]|jgi:hypothetical protein|nr:hypothetical protein [Tolypothrix brevis GSE-NOS-MK-07-07A]
MYLLNLKYAVIKFNESDRITLTGGLTFSNLNISQSGNDTFISVSADLLESLLTFDSRTYIKFG